MKYKSKSLFSVILIGFLACTIGLYGCSESSPLEDPASTSQEEAVYSEKDSEGYTVWHMGKNDLGNGVVINLEGFSEKDSSNSTNPALLLEALSSNTGPMSAEFDKKFGRINDNTSYYCQHSGKNYVSEEQIENGIIESHKKQCHRFNSPAYNSAGDTNTATIAQVKCSSPDLIVKRLQQAQTEKWKIAEQLADNVWKFHERDADLMIPEGKEPCVDDTWYVIYTDGMITVVKYQNSKYGTNENPDILTYPKAS